MNEKVYLIAIIVLGIIIGFFVGYSAGYTSGVFTSLNWGVSKAVYFLELKNVSLDIDKSLIADGLTRYKNNIGGCWAIENKTTLPTFN